MSKITICPHYLLNYPKTTANDIERFIIFPLSKCLDRAIKDNVSIVVSKEILDLAINNFPWNDLHDNPEWKPYISDWYLLTLGKITKHSDIINTTKLNCVNINTNINEIECSNLSDDINFLFSIFLDIFTSKTMPKKQSEEGIFANKSCGNNLTHSGCYIFHTPDNIHFVKYPWLRIYKKHLPYAGDYPFKPPSNWKQNQNPQKGNQNGFLDADGNEWVWDKLHDNHWDVQQNGSSKYKNISCEGEVL